MYIIITFIHYCRVYMSLRITVAINKQNCELLYNHCFLDVIDRNIFNGIAMYSTCTLHICWADIKEYIIVLLHCCPVMISSILPPFVLIAGLQSKISSHIYLIVPNQTNLPSSIGPMHRFQNYIQATHSIVTDRRSLLVPAKEGTYWLVT